MYIRKTVDEYLVQQYTGREYGWEEVCSEGNRLEAKQRAKEYRENQPEYPVRVTKVRIAKEVTKC